MQSKPCTTSASSQMIPLRNIEPSISVGKAEQEIGKLSNPSKMPARAWGISAKHCKTGAKLAKIKGTACHACYARRGNYCRTNVQRAMDRRLKGLTHPQWKEMMKVLILHQTPIAVPYFRWFDSGDLQSYKQLLDILWIAKELPEIKFWLPTQERRYLRRLIKEVIAGERSIPNNIVLRYSAPMMGESAEDQWPTTSMVVTDGSETCHASRNAGQCGDCRMCWDRSVNVVKYKRH